VDAAHFEARQARRDQRARRTTVPRPGGGFQPQPDSASGPFNSRRHCPRRAGLWPRWRRAAPGDSSQLHPSGVSLLGTKRTLT